MRLRSTRMPTQAEQLVILAELYPCFTSEKKTKMVEIDWTRGIHSPMAGIGLTLLGGYTLRINGEQNQRQYYCSLELLNCSSLLCSLVRNR
jgi:hypothetical protein